MIDTWLIRIKIVKKISQKYDLIRGRFDHVNWTINNVYGRKSIPKTRESIEIEVSCKIV